MGTTANKAESAESDASTKLNEAYEVVLLHNRCTFEQCWVCVDSFGIECQENFGVTLELRTNEIINGIFRPSSYQLCWQIIKTSSILKTTFTYFFHVSELTT